MKTETVLLPSLLLWMATIVIGGCGSGGSGPEDPDPEGGYVEGLKNEVVDTLMELQRDPAVVDYLGELIEEGFQADYEGEHKEMIDKLRTGMEELQSMNASARKPKIDELLELARSLPGELTSEEESDVGDEDG